MKKSNLPKVLYIGDKWCSGNLQFGLSEWEGNLWKSLESTGLVNLKLFHFDDFFHKFNKLGDDALIDKIEKFKPDIVCMVIYRIPGSDFNVPTWQTFDIIKNRFKIPMVAIWGDLAKREQVKLSQSLLPYITINIATETTAALRRINNPKKYIYMWVPKDPRIFNNPNWKRNIDVSYAGSIKKDRLERFNYLIRNGVPVYYRGGEREEHLKTKNFANIYKHSKITLSFSRNDYSHVTNARPFEAMSCGAMVLEEESFETPKLFIPYVDYVPYTNKEDLLEKIRYYLKHDKERETIAQNGHKKVLRSYSAKNFWRLLIDRALKRSSRSTNNLLFLKSSNLLHLTRWKRLKLMFLDTFCSNRLGIRIYKAVMIVHNRRDWENQMRIFLFPSYLYFQKHISPQKFESILKILRFIFHVKKRG